MPVIDQVGLVVLTAVFMIQVGARDFLGRHVKKFWAAAFLLIFGIYGYWSAEQYLVWKNNEFTKFFLPPYNSISYFLYYVGTRFFAAPVLALVAAAAIYEAATWMNDRFGNRFFEDEEPMVATLAALIVGYPGFVFYIPALLFAGLVLSLVYSLCGWGRAPLYFLWLPTAIFVIIIMHVYFSGIYRFFGL